MPANPVRALILVDGTAIRQTIQKDYQKAIRELQASRAQLDHFQTVDLPEFRRWLNQHFGALITELRTLSRQVAEQESLVFVVESEVFFGGVSHARAYQEVHRARETPEPPPAETDDQGKTRPHSGSAGRDPGDAPEEDDDPFSEFWEDPDSMHSREGHGPDLPSSPKREDKTPRLKELYRAVVRRLHPDRQQEMTPQMVEWWHQAQAAYQAGDENQLEVILTLHDINALGTTRHTTASLLHRITAQIKSSLRQIKQTLAHSRKDPAWNFSQRDDLFLLAARVRRDMEREREQMRFRSQELQAMITKWRTAADKLKQPRRRKRPRVVDDIPF